MSRSFREWIIATHAHEPTAMGDLARDIREDSGSVCWPDEETRKEIGYHLESSHGASDKVLGTFDEAWSQYEDEEATNA